MFSAALSAWALPDGDDGGTGAVCPGFEWDDVEEFESAQSAVTHMGLGWNLGNSLDANSGNAGNMWIECWSQRRPVDYETSWGQPATTRELIHMMKEAGFKTVRVPVTWYPHIGNFSVTTQRDGQGNTIAVWDQDTWTGTQVDSAWMARVKEVVDYVIAEDMYCILNVHHDTGDASTAWIKADPASFSRQKARYEALWRQIATQFKGYGQHLLFEGYNEMLDGYGSWNYASFNCSGNYDATVASQAYQTVNDWAQTFVNTIRQSGGNNITRNLIVCPYAASCGDGTWSNHLSDPLTQMSLPTDSLQQHILFEVHCYPYFESMTEAKTAVDRVCAGLKSHLQPKAPVIFGEWGSGNANVTYQKTPQLLCQFAKYFVDRARVNNMAPLYWMGLSDGTARSVPEFNEPDLRDAMIDAFRNGYSEETAIEMLEQPCRRVARLQRMGEKWVILSDDGCHNLDGTLFAKSK